MKKIISIILTVCIMFCIFSSTSVIVSAVSSGVVGDCRWQLNGTELTITGNGSMDYYVSWPWGNNITDLTIEQGVTTIGIAAFYDCKSLKNVTLPDSLMRIEDFAFYGCESLSEITIPESVVSIGIEAFSNCKKLVNVSIPKNVTQMGKGVFEQCDKLNSIIVDEYNPNYSSLDGVLFNKDKTILIKYPSCKYQTSYIIPDSVKQIEDHAFYESWLLEDISIPDTVMRIGLSAFFNTPYYNKANYVNGILYLGKHIIDADENYSSFIIRKDTKTIADGAFVVCEKVKEIIIPDGVVTIGGNAFSWCSNLEKVYIPETVKTIGESAFYDCNKLKNIYYSGNSADRNKITVERYNSELNKITWNYESCYSLPTHIYDNDCDNYCNVCSHYRTAEHKYEHGCDNECNICFEVRTTAHQYDSDRDFICNNCNYARTPTQPVVVAVTSNAVMLLKYDGVEYSLDGINWQSSNIFFHLEESTEYVVYQRVAPASNVTESQISDVTVFVTLEKVEYISGDCNNDGNVDTSDLANIKLYLCGLGIVEIGADVNGDGVIDTTDLAAIKLLLAGMNSPN